MMYRLMLGILLLVLTACSSTGGRLPTPLPPVPPPEPVPAPAPSRPLNHPRRAPRSGKMSRWRRSVLSPHPAYAG